jgi:hypothetical protein
MQSQYVTNRPYTARRSAEAAMGSLLTREVKQIAGEALLRLQSVWVDQFKASLLFPFNFLDLTAFVWRFLQFRQIPGVFDAISGRRVLESRLHEPFHESVLFFLRGERELSLQEFLCVFIR